MRHRNRERHPYAVGGSPSRSGKGPIQRPLTGNRHPPSWRAEPGSDPRPDGQDFALADNSGRCSAVFNTAGHADPARRYPDRWDVGWRRCSTIQSHWQVFHPDRADHFQGAGDQFQLLHADFAEGTPPLLYPDSWFPQDPVDVSAGKGAGNGRRWRDRRNWRGTADRLPVRVAIRRLLFPAFQQASASSTCRRSFSSGYRTTFDAVFLSVLPQMLLSRAFVLYFLLARPCAERRNDSSLWQRD